VSGRWKLDIPWGTPTATIQFFHFHFQPPQCIFKHGEKSIDGTAGLLSMSQHQDESEYEDYWNYLSYKLLTRLEEEQFEWRSVTSTQFSKLPCIVDHYLDDQLDREINFPRYWYKYGEVGNREPLDSSLYLKEEADSYGGLKIRPAKPSVDFDIDPEAKADIDEAVEFVVGHFANMKTDRIKEFQYKHFAPNTFIQIFNDFREMVYDLAGGGDGATVDASAKEELLTLLDRLESAYDPDQYDVMEDDFKTWIDITRELIDHDEIGRVEAQLEEFWEVFSKVHLRMNHNTNPIEDQMRRWELENEMRLDRYHDQLEDLESELLSNNN
jgi:hypothetical protein